MRTCVVALEGVLDSSLSLTVDILAAANRLCKAIGRPPAFSVQVVGARRRTIRTGAGYRLTLDGVLRGMRSRPQLVIVPGWNEPDADIVGESLAGAEARIVVEFL